MNGRTQLVLTLVNSLVIVSLVYIHVGPDVKEEETVEAGPGRGVMGVLRKQQAAQVVARMLDTLIFKYGQSVFSIELYCVYSVT
jgi:hypothetical protein